MLLTHAVGKRRLGGEITVLARSPVVAENPGGKGPFVILCDHASNRIPEDYSSFAFDEDSLLTHIAWDPGALGVARHLSRQLDAPLLWPDVTRLLIDCNRAPEADSLIVTLAEGRDVPANRGLGAEERARRLAGIHAPYHDAIDATLARRDAARLPTALIAVHSYTPVFLGRARPWQVGIVFDDDRRLADGLIEGLEADPSLSVGINEPYAPADQVYYTVARHAGRWNLPGVMIEIRNDEIADAAGQLRWAERLGDLLASAQANLMGAGRVAV